MKQTPKLTPEKPLVPRCIRRRMLSRGPRVRAVIVLMLALLIEYRTLPAFAAAPEPTPTILPQAAAAFGTAQEQIPSSSSFDSAVWPWKQENPEPKARLEAAVNANESGSKAVSGSASATSAAAANNITSAGEFGGASFRVAVSGNYAYIGTGYRLSILNVSNPAALTLSGRTQAAWADKVLGIALKSNNTNTYAYVAAGSEGLRVVDASDPKNPADVGFYNTPGFAWDLAVSGNYAFIADGVSGLQVVDITTPYAPQPKATLDTPGKAMDVAVDAHYAYIADETGGLRIVDINTPANPLEVGSLKTNGRAVGLVVSGDTLYLADDKDGLRVIDVTTRTAPKEVGAFDTARNAYSVDFDANTNVVYVADSGDGLRAVDVSSPTAPKEVGHFDISGCWANDVKISGSYAYLVDTAHGLRVLNATNPSQISPVFLYNTPAPTDAKVSGNYTYLTSGSAGLRIINTTKASTAIEAGYFDTPGYAYAVALVTPPGGSSVYALVADWDKGLRVIDVTTPSAPHEVGFRDTPGMARDVAVLYPYAYVADSNQGLQIINISDPTNPVLSSTCDQVTCMPNGGEARGIVVASALSDSHLTYAYVSDGSMGLRLIDVSDPLHPAQLGYYDTPGEANRVALSPQTAYAYVADGFGGGVQVVDISNPASLVSLGAFDTDGSASAIISVKSADLGGDYLFLADGQQGLRLILVEMVNGSRPRLSEKAFYVTRGWAGSLSVVDSRAYIADGEDGLNILDTAEEKVLHTISGKVVTDQGSNLADVTISAGSTLSTVTAADGTYTLGGLMSQDYTITPSLSGYIFSPSSFTVNLKEAIKNKNFTAARALGDGFISTGEVVDANGVPLSGVIVTLTGEGSNAQAVLRAVTDVTGEFNIKGLAAQTYTLVPQKDGFVFSPENRTLSFAVDAASQQEASQKQQFVGKPAGVIGFVKDLKGAPIAAVTITSDCAEKASTDAHGKYVLSIVKAGNCTLSALKDGFIFTPQTITIQTPNLASQDFQAAAKSVVSISGSVLDKDGKPLKDVKLTSDCSTPVLTDERGIYLLNDVKGRACTLSPSMEGFTFTPEKLTVIIPEGVVGQQTAAGQRFTGTASVINGRVIDGDGKPLAGVNLSVNGGATVVSDEQGIYSLNGLSAGSYTLLPQKDGINFSPPRLEFTLPANSSKLSDFVGRAALGTLKGKVKDALGSPLVGVVISDGAGHQLFSDQNGDFQFNLPAGAVTVSVSKEGYTFSPPSVQLLIPADNVEFIAKANDYQFAGKVSDKNGSPLVGVAMNVGSGVPIITDQNGNYSLLFKAGAYTIKPIKEGYSFTPPAVDVKIPGDSLQQNFTAVGNDYKVPGKVSDRSGQPYAGIKVVDSAGNGVSSDQNGVFEFTFKPGNYRLTPQKDGYTFTPAYLDISLPATGLRADFTIEGKDYTISGRVSDINGKAVENVILKDSSDQAITTDQNGNYMVVKKPGTYKITPQKEGYLFSPQYSEITVPPDGNNNNFIAEGQDINIYGAVMMNDGLPLAGVVLADDGGGQTQSVQNGSYSLTHKPGVYTITPSKDGYVFTPASQVVTLPSQSPLSPNNTNFTAGTLCSDLLPNGSFERDTNWNVPNGENKSEPVSYSLDQAYSGTRSMKIGLVPGDKNVAGHRVLRQKVILPKNLKSVILRFWLFATSTDIEKSGDAQMLLILDQELKEKERPVSLHSNERTWQPFKLDLSKYAGQTFWLYYEVYNDGKDGVSGMYLDDISLQVCDK